MHYLSGGRENKWSNGCPAENYDISTGFWELTLAVRAFRASYAPRVKLSRTQSSRYSFLLARNKKAWIQQWGNLRQHMPGIPYKNYKWHVCGWQWSSRLWHHNIRCWGHIPEVQEADLQTLPPRCSCSLPLYPHAEMSIYIPFCIWFSHLL